MRGVLVVSILISVLLLSGCTSTTDTSNYHDISAYNKVLIIDFPYEDIDASELESLDETYKNENKALSLYRKTLDLFRDEQPFASIMIKQEYQIGLLDEVYTKYELVIPEENWYPKVTNFDNPGQACSSAILFAEQSIDLYNKWLDNQGMTYAVDNQDLRFLYTKLRDDYEKILIPQFERCERRFN